MRLSISAEDMVSAGAMIPSESLHPARDLLFCERYGGVIRELVEHAYPGMVPEGVLGLADDWVARASD